MVGSRRTRHGWELICREEASARTSGRVRGGGAAQRARDSGATATLGSEALAVARERRVERGGNGGGGRARGRRSGEGGGRAISCGVEKIGEEKRREKRKGKGKKEIRYVGPIFYLIFFLIRMPRYRNHSYILS